MSICPNSINTHKKGINWPSDDLLHLSRASFDVKDLLEDKVIDTFSQLNITISVSDIEDCHRLGKTNPKNTIVPFVNWKFCSNALEKKKQLMSLNKTELGFKSDVALYISENLTPFNQYLAW